MEDSGKKQSGNQSDLNLVRRRLDPSLAEMVPVQGSYREEGQIFLDRLTEDLCHLLKKRMVWVAEYLPETLELLTVSVRFSGDHPKLPLRYPIRGGPCEAAYDTEALVHIPDRLIELFPENPHLKSLGALSYLAVPLRSQEGRLIGHFAVLDDLPMSVSKELSFFFHALQDRVSQELQRVWTDPLILEDKMGGVRSINHDTAATISKGSARKARSGNSFRSEFHGTNFKA